MLSAPRGLMMSAACATLLLAGSISPAPKPEPTPMSPAVLSLQPPPASPAPRPRRAGFDDPQLDQLIADALQALEETMARLRAGTRRSRKRAPRPSELN